jgi:hypothetical protein
LAPEYTPGTQLALWKCDGAGDAPTFAKRVGSSLYPLGQKTHHDAPGSPSLGPSLMRCARLKEMARELSVLGGWEEVER